MKQQKRFTRKNGITLISLVITIVIMLILASVAISIAVDPKGLFGKAEQAKTDWGAKVNEEQIKIDEALGYLPIELPEGWEPSKVADVVEDKENNRKAPIPVGYTASKVSTEDEISEGLVIYQTDDGQSAVKEEPNSDAHKAAMESRNQYVWIPVDDVNDMVMCKKNNIDEGAYEENGKTITTKTCKLVYDFSTDEITCQTHNYITSTELSDDLTSPNFIDTTGLAGRVYTKIGYINLKTTTDTEKPYVYTTNIAFTEAEKDVQKFVANSSNPNLGSFYREPDLVTYFDKDDVITDNDETNDNMKIAGVDSANELKHQLNNNFIEMAKSVAKYGGFYISRYEQSYENNKVISKKNKAVFSALTVEITNYIQGNRWYGLYNKTLNSVEKGKSVSSHMVWGCQYDQIIKFLGKEKGETGHTYLSDKYEKTGYEYEENGTKYVDKDILNNIYDLEGNNYEWTALAYDVYHRVSRGSNFWSMKEDSTGPYCNPASNAGYNNPEVNDMVYTTRPTLYIR